MKNREMIKKAFAEFSIGNFSECEKTLCRLKNCFEIDDDEVSFDLVAEIKQPLKEIAEKLISENKGYLIGDATYRVEDRYLDQQLKITILFRAHEPYDIYAGEDDEESFEYRLIGHYRFSADGDIAASTGNGGNATKVMRDHVKKQIMKWLNAEFGAVSEY